MTSQLENAARDLASAMAGLDLKGRIALIEAEGWHLDAASYVYVPDTSWTNGSDDSTSTSHRGQVQGHFIFRPAPIPAAADQDAGARNLAPVEVVDESDDVGSNKQR